MFQYGEIEQYGKYILSTTDGQAIGEHVTYKIRTHSKENGTSDWVRMSEDRIYLSDQYPLNIRIRAGKGDWVYSQTERINNLTHQVRIRGISKDGDISPWVRSESGELEEI